MPNCNIPVAGITQFVTPVANVTAHGSAMPQRFAYQLYSSRNFGPVEQTLVMLKAAGYSAVEGFGGVYGAPAKLRAALDANGLLMPSGHFGLDMLEDKPAEVMAIARTLGMTTLVMPWLSSELRPADSAGWRSLASRLAALTRRYRPEGFAVAYHNHDFEFVPTSDGAVPQALLFEAAPLLDWEIDVAWVVRGGEDAVKWITDYRSIITIAHVKDIAPQGQNADEDGWSDVGQGTVDWKACRAALAQSRCMSFVMEHDNPKDDRRFATTSIAAARQL